VKLNKDQQYREALWIGDVRFDVAYELFGPLGDPKGVAIIYIDPICGVPDPNLDYESIILKELENDLL